MFRIAVCSVLLASVTATRVRVGEAKAQEKVGLSCARLQSKFHDRVNALQTLLDAHPGESSFSMTTQARFSMKSFSVARVLRRARTCSWVVDGSEDIEHMRGIVQTMLAGNPCAEAARAELAAGTSHSDESIKMNAVRRALSVLMSENCEVGQLEEISDVDEDSPSEEELEVQIEEAEQQAEESVEEAMDATLGEEESAFVEINSKGRFGGFFRSLGVLVLFLYLVLACSLAAGVIGAYIVIFLIELGVLAGCVTGFCPMAQVMGGFMAGYLLGLGSCAYTLATQLLPRLEVTQPLGISQ